MSARVLSLRPGKQPPAPPPPPPADPLAYTPPFPRELKAAMSALHGANSQAQRITSGDFTTVGQAMRLPDLLDEIVRQAQAARRTL